jgi:hypothetical protein
MTVKRLIAITTLAMTFIFLFFGSRLLLSAQGLVALDAIQRAHGSPVIAPTSIQMTGVVERDGKTEPFRLVATRDEELRIEYGGLGKDSLVLSQILNFRDDGEKVSFLKSPSGFSQLDITGVFFVQQLRNRAVRVEATPDRMTIGDVPTRRLLVHNERAQFHRGTLRVGDQVDLYVTDIGILAGVSRTFYEGRPERYTQAFRFSDYRKINGELLPFRIEVYIKSQRRQTLLVQEYQFDVPVERDLFKSRRAR